MAVDRSKSVLLVSLLLAALLLKCGGNVTEVEASSSTFQGDLILTGNNVTVIENKEFEINGSIIVQGNATLVLRNALLNFMQSAGSRFGLILRNPSGGNPRLLIENATMLGNDYYLTCDLMKNSSASVYRLVAPKLYLYAHESSTMMISDSTILDVGGMGRSVVSLSNCSLWAAEVRDDSTYKLVGCTIDILQAYSTQSIDVVGSSVKDYVALSTRAANCSADRLVPGLVTKWSFPRNCSVLVAPGGKASNLTLMDTQVNGWVFTASDSNVRISNSNLRGVYCSGTTNLMLTNSTAPQMQENIRDLSQVVVRWYLEVHVVDSIGQDVPSADVEARFSNGTAAEWKLTDSDGWARLTLMEKLLNATMVHRAGSYSVRATYGPHSAATTVDMTESKRITLRLPDVVVAESHLFLTLLLFPALALFTARKLDTLSVQSLPEAEGSRPPSE